MRQFFGTLSHVLLLLLLLGSPAPAQWVKPFKSDLYESNSDLEKVSSQLLEARKMLREGKSKAQVQSAMPSVPFANDAPEIEVRLKTLTPEIVEQMRAIGMNVTGVYYEYARVVGTCDPMLLDQIAAIPEVRTIHPNYRPLHNVGSVTSQADTAIRANQARAQFGVDGTNVPVGILSDSFDSSGNGSISGGGCARTVKGTASQNSNDLPASVILLQDDQGDDEGRAMAELIHDLAPKAPLLFSTGNNGEAAFAAGIDLLRACGAKVIVDDLVYYSEPMFQDGIVAQAAQAAVDAGVSYFSSATNYGRVGIDDEYVDGAPNAPNNNFHRFANGAQVADITLPPGCGVRLVLQWADPFDGVLGGGASTDFDIELFDCSSGECEPIPGAIADGVQGCSLQAGAPGGDPIETLESSINDSGLPLTVSLAVNRICGSARRFRIGVTPTGGCGFPSTYVFDASVFKDPQIYGHAAAAGVVAVAAVDYREIGQAGDFTPPLSVINVEDFSSRGGNLPFFFTGSGSPLPGAPQLRAKPEIAAPDNTNTSFFIQGFDPDGDGFPNFNGTSAAAPHAAAVAALIRQKNPSLSPAGVLHALTSTADDIESPGFDFLSGFGLIDALGAVQAAGGSTPTQGALENPQPGFQSGIGLVSGWVCDANHVTFQVDSGALKDAAYGTSRGDTVGVCGDANNGFGALLNWNLLGDGTHTLRAFADGIQFGSATFDVTTLGTAFLRGASGQYLLNNFPFAGDSVVLRWQEASQNFVIADTQLASSADQSNVVPQASVTGVLENPGGNSSFQSGIGVISGWVCSAGHVTLSIDGGTQVPAGYGTSRGDTVSICGDSNNGFGRLINWNLLGDGTHTVAAFADGMQFGQATFTVMTLGTNFLTGVTGQYALANFAGGTVVVRWQEAQQNFVIIGRD